MNKTYVFEGSTTNEAIEKGLKELNVSKNQVEIKVLEENKRSFFSILAPRVVKVEFTIKSSNYSKSNIRKEKSIKKELVVSDEEILSAKEFLEKFIKEFLEKLDVKDIKYEMVYSENILKLDLKGEKIKMMIGYRGETLNALESILNAILKNNNINLRVTCNVNNFREKRELALREQKKSVLKYIHT